jgi:hypothetical protein
MNRGMTSAILLYEARIAAYLERIEELEAALIAVKTWLMSDEDGDVYGDSCAWREDFRKALALTRKALEPRR